MDTYSNHKIPSYFMSFIPLVLIVFSLVSCTVLKDIYEERQAEKNSLIVGGDTTLYKSYKDTSSDEIIEVGTMVIKTGGCRKSYVEEGKMMCPIKGVYSSKEGWVLEYTLLRFEDYLPGEGD